MAANSDHGTAMAELKSQHGSAMAELKSQHDTAMARLKSQHGREAKDWKAAVARRDIDSKLFKYVVRGSSDPLLRGIVPQVHF